MYTSLKAHFYMQMVHNQISDSNTVVEKRVKAFKYSISKTPHRFSSQVILSAKCCRHLQSCSEVENIPVQYDSLYLTDNIVKIGVW